MNYTSNSLMTFLSCRNIRPQIYIVLFSHWFLSGRNIRQILRRPLIYIVLFSHWFPSFWSQHRPISFDWVLVEFSTSINSVTSNKLPLLWVNLSSKFLSNLCRSRLLKFPSANNWFKLSSNAFCSYLILDPNPVCVTMKSIIVVFADNSGLNWGLGNLVITHHNNQSWFPQHRWILFLLSLDLFF